MSKHISKKRANEAATKRTLALHHGEGRSSGWSRFDFVVREYKKIGPLTIWEVVLRTSARGDHSGN